VFFVVSALSATEKPNPPSHVVAFILLQYLVFVTIFLYWSKPAMRDNECNQPIDAQRSDSKGIVWTRQQSDMVKVSSLPYKWTMNYQYRLSLLSDEILLGI